MADTSRLTDAKAALDDERAFKARSKGVRLFGSWAAERMGLAGDEAAAYARDVVMADFEEAGDDDVLRKVAKDTGIDSGQLRQELDRCLAEGAHGVAERP